MMYTKSLNRKIIALGIPLFLLVFLALYLSSPFFKQSTEMDLAVSIDLILTVPFIYYLGIRKFDIPKTTVVPIMVLGLVVGTYFLPKESQTYLSLFKTWALPIIELSVLALVFLKVKKAITTFKDLKGTSPDFFTILKCTCYELVPEKLVLPFATEIAVFYYGFVNWKTYKLNDNEYSNHINSGSVALFGALLLVIIIETIAIHFLLGSWSPTLSWIITLLSIYSFFQIFGFVRSLPKRPIIIGEDRLSLRYGIMNETEILFSEIEKIELDGKVSDDLMHLSFLGELESHNITITLNTKNVLLGLYGFKKKYNKIGFHLDKPVEFKNKLEEAI